MGLHPVQDIYIDHYGTLRFKTNKIVEFLLDNGGYDMNKLAMIDFSDEDRIQFAQLIGYSVSGFGTLSYVSDEAWSSTSDVVDEFYNNQGDEQWFVGGVYFITQKQLVIGNG